MTPLRSKSWLILSGCAFAMALPSQVLAQNLLDWQALGGSGAIQSASTFTLKNVTDKESLKYGSQTFGINLVWDKKINVQEDVVSRRPHEVVKSLRALTRSSCSRRRW